MAVIKVYVKPMSRRDALYLDGDTLVFECTERPVGGRVNTALIKTISKILGVERHSVLIVSGYASRVKILRIKGIDQDVLEEKLKRLGRSKRK